MKPKWRIKYCKDWFFGWPAYNVQKKYFFIWITKSDLHRSLDSAERKLESLKNPIKKEKFKNQYYYYE